VVAFYLYVLRVSWRLRRYDRQIALISALFCLAVLVLNVKEQSLLTRHGFMVTALLLCIWYHRPDALRAGGEEAHAAGGEAAAGTSELVHAYDPGGPAGGRITVTPAANLVIEAQPARLAIRPGQQVSMRLSVRRGAAFAGRVPIEIKNLPQGVRVLNIGLNGVLITEKESERTIFLQAEPWVGGLERPFFAVGKAEAAGTEHSSPPIFLVVKPGGGEAQAAAGTR